VQPIPQTLARGSAQGSLPLSFLGLQETVPSSNLNAARLLRVTSHTRVRITGPTARRTSSGSPSRADRAVTGLVDPARLTLVDLPRVGGLAAEMDSLRELLAMHPIWPSRLPCPSGMLVFGNRMRVRDS
jgi:hypothetical protein